MNRPPRKLCASLVLITMLACAGFCVVGCKNPWTAQGGSAPPPALSLEEFHAHVTGGTNLILDARNADDFRRGHVPGAVNLPDGSFTEDYGKLGYIFDQHRD